MFFIAFQVERETYIWSKYPTSKSHHPEMPNWGLKDLRSWISPTPQPSSFSPCLPSHPQPPFPLLSPFLIALQNPEGNMLLRDQEPWV